MRSKAADNLAPSDPELPVAAYRWPSDISLFSNGRVRTSALACLSGFHPWPFSNMNLRMRIKLRCASDHCLQSRCSSRHRLAKPFSSSRQVIVCSACSNCFSLKSAQSTVGGSPAARRTPLKGVLVWGSAVAWSSRPTLGVETVATVSLTSSKALILKHSKNDRCRLTVATVSQIPVSSSSKTTPSSVVSQKVSFVPPPDG